MNRFEQIEQIGEQSQGIIHTAINSQTKEKVIIKQYKKKIYTWQDCMQLREIKVLRVFNHPNIVKLKELIKENTTLYSVYEYTETNLFQFYQELRDNNGSLSELEIKNIMYQIFSALHYTHKMKFFHRDLCLENIYINEEDQHIKISNFTASREIQAKTQLTDYITTRWYRAPEQLLHAPVYNYKIDAWAAGCIMAELFLMGPLFGGNSEKDQLTRILKYLGNPQDWPEFYALANKLHLDLKEISTYKAQDLKKEIRNATPEAIDLLKKLLVCNPQKRFNCQQALKHPFFTGGNINTPHGSFIYHQQQQSQQSHPSQFSKLPQIHNQQYTETILNSSNPHQASQDLESSSKEPSKQQQQPQSSIKEEDEISQHSNQSNKPVPLDVQQQQMALRRPGSRDCSREQRENNAQIKHEKEMGEINTGNGGQNLENGELNMNPLYNQNQQSEIIINFTQDQTKEQDIYKQDVQVHVVEPYKKGEENQSPTKNSGGNMNKSSNSKLNRSDSSINEDHSVSVNPDTKVYGVQVNADMNKITDYTTFQKIHNEHVQQDNLNKELEKLEEQQKRDQRGSRNIQQDEQQQIQEQQTN